MNEPSNHEQKLAALVAQMKALQGQAAHFDKGGVHHVVPLPGDRRFAGKRVDLRAFGALLAIDEQARTAVAEPGVTFAELARETLKRGLLPGVVPELEGITVGGAIAGCSVESMSWRLGGFHDTCSELEVVTGAGEVLHLTPEGTPLELGMVHGSYGTLGALTRATFALTPAKPYVRMEYVTLPSVEAFEERMRAHIAAADADFIDGIVHGPEQHVLCLGRFVDEAPHVSSYRRTKIFYKSTARLAEDYLTTFDYLFRYDTECHWLSRSVPPLEWRPVRWLLGRWVLGSTNLIRWSGRMERLLALKRRPDVVVDVFIPARRFGEFFEWYAREFRYYPLWIVPYLIPKPYPWVSAEHAARMDDTLFIDCAVYGKRNSEPDVDWSQVLEEKTWELGGIKTLISRNHYTPERFWEIYHRDNYAAAKARLDPHGVFPNVYDKLCAGAHAEAAEGS
jgi:FAD/FMN-containing dehydrogenase